MPTEKEIDAATLAIQEERAKMWDSFNKDRIIKTGGSAFNARVMRDDIARALAKAALEAGYQVFLDEASERHEKHIDDNIDVYKRLADR